MIKYRAAWSHSPRIEVFEVEKETKLTVSYSPYKNCRARRERKISDDHGWFDSFDEAKAALVAELEQKVVRVRENLQHANDRLGNAKGLRNPTEAT